MRGLQPDVKWGPAGVSANRSLLEQTVIAVQMDTIPTPSASVRLFFHSCLACFLFSTFLFTPICHWCLKMMSYFVISSLWIDCPETFLGLLQQQPAFKPCIVSLSGSYAISQRWDYCCNFTGVSLVHIMSHRRAQCTSELVLLLCSALEALFLLSRGIVFSK